MACKHDSPIPCPARKAAMLDGQMFFAYGMGWLWLRSRDVTKPWRTCPFCGEPLPTMEGAVERLSREGWVDTYDGEQGG